ncbi:MAG: glutathione S-transferase [Rhodocyclaceae bacterium]|nr:glutathione S-transferase [Rhodocyclaceae bacterium]
MLDSPYVRRCHVIATRLGIPFEHKALSVFRDFSEFHAINPLVRAPTLLLDDGRCLMDSGLIIQHFEALRPGQGIIPPAGEKHTECLRLTALGLSMCDKAVQLYYEIVVRPETLRWAEWITRLTGQLRESAEALEAACPADGWLQGAAVPNLADVTAAVAWRFTHYVLPQILDRDDYARLDALGTRAEALPEFQAAHFD